MIQMSFVLEFEEGHERRIHSLPCVASEDEVGVRVVLQVLDRELVAVVRLEHLEQVAHVLLVRQGVPAAVAEEEREVVGDRRDVVGRRRRLPIVLRVVRGIAVVVLGKRPSSDHCRRSV